MVSTYQDKRNTRMQGGSLWMTRRKYLSVHAAKHGVIALKLHGWKIDEAVYPTRDHRVVATKGA